VGSRVGEAGLAHELLCLVDVHADGLGHQVPLAVLADAAVARVLRLDAEGHRQADWQLIARVRERVRWPARQLATAVAVASGLRTHVSGIRTAQP